MKLKYNKLEKMNRSKLKDVSFLVSAAGLKLLIQGLRHFLTHSERYHIKEMT